MPIGVSPEEKKAKKTSSAKSSSTKISSSKESSVKTSSKTSAKDSTKVSKSAAPKTVSEDTSKVLKANELGGGGFLSGLGFSQKQEVVQNIHEDEIVPEAAPKKVVLEKAKTPSAKAAPKTAPQSEQVVAPKQEVVASKNDFLSNLMAGKDTTVAPSAPVILQSRQDTSSTVTKEDLFRSSHQHTQHNAAHQTPRPAGQTPISRPAQAPRPGQQRAPIHGGSQRPAPYQHANRPGQHNNNTNRPGQNNTTTSRPGQHNHAVEQAPKKIQKEATTSENLVKKVEIVIDEKITVKEFAEKMGVALPLVMKKLLENKIMIGLTSSLDFDTAVLIGEELGVIIKKKENKVTLDTFVSGDLQAILDLDKDAEIKEVRPPIVTVMGHVDHGKTSLLDYFRKTGVANGEAGGITQSIGASVVEHDGKKICFIDTPGHELFTSLRSRGAKLTNIAVIVVAADDGVMPQTAESIGHAKDAGVPIIIAVTKIDKPGKTMDQIKQDLARYEIVSEDWGGDVPVIGVSSKTGQGIGDLLEAILLQSEMLDLKYNPKRSAVGVVVDAHKDPKQGVVSTIIIMTGSLRVGDVIVAYNTYGKVRRMQNWKGHSIPKAVGGDPIQILGITDLPEPGRLVEVVANEKEAQARVASIQEQVKKHSPESALQQFVTGLKSGTKEAELRLILKSDGSSSIEALKQAVGGLTMPRNVTIKVVHSDAGHFNDSDLSLAQASGSLLLGYNISLNSLLKKKADSLKIEMKSFDIIYELTDYLDKLLLGMVEIETHEVMIGKMEIKGIFFTKGKEMVVGGKIIEGKVKNKLKFRLLRGEEILTQGDIVSLHRNRDEVKEVGEGEECGIKVHVGKKVEIGDVLEFLEIQEVKEEKVQKDQKGAKDTKEDATE